MGYRARQNLKSQCSHSSERFLIYPRVGCNFWQPGGNFWQTLTTLVQILTTFRGQFCQHEARHLIGWKYSITSDLPPIINYAARAITRGFPDSLSEVKNRSGRHVARRTRKWFYLRSNKVIIRLVHTQKVCKWCIEHAHIKKMYRTIQSGQMGQWWWHSHNFATLSPLSFHFAPEMGSHCKRWQDTLVTYM